MCAPRWQCRCWTYSGILARTGRRSSPSTPSRGKPLRAKPADIVLFDSAEHSGHRDRESSGWVADHALMVVELKKPEVPLVAAGSSFLQYNVSDALGLRWLEWAGYMVSLAALVGFPISIGIAMV